MTNPDHPRRETLEHLETVADRSRRRDPPGGRAPSTPGPSLEVPHSRRGELRVYLGAAPGVGKTYAALNEAHRRLDRGTDVVVGLVETHGRPRTAVLLEGLEVLPRTVVEHRGARLPAREAVGGRRGDPRRRHRCHLDGQRAAPGVPR